jgi:hypothetical protein
MMKKKNNRGVRRKGTGTEKGKGRGMQRED